VDIAAIDLKTGILLWSAQTMTIGAVFIMLWLHKTKRRFHLFFALGFCLSSFGASISYFFNFALPLGPCLPLLAHSFWLMGTLNAQGRRIEPWVLSPLLVYIAALLVPFIRSSEQLIILSQNIAGLIGFCLLSISLMTTRQHKSLTRKFLAMFLLCFGLTIAFLGTVAPMLNEIGSYYSVAFVVAQSATTIFGLTIILMSAAKMVIEDNERRLTHLALTDHLTGVYNRRALETIFDQARSEEANPELFIAISMFDIDHFKKINDHNGHAFGDYVLTAFVKLVSERLGNHDDLIRMGGEEFAVISRVTRFGDAASLAEKIRIDFGNLPLRVGDKAVRATVSAGIAAQPVAKADLYMLLSMADRGLYAAKKAGRDRCVIYDESTSVTIPSKQRDTGDEIEINTDKQVAVLNRIAAIAEAHKTAP
jgi:diguanylate cyclase (GGDEF)-like protein